MDSILDKVVVIVVDDHPIWRRGLCSVLESKGTFEILAEIESGEEAIHLSREHHPDLLVMDISLPDINGLQVASRLKDEVSTAIIVLSSYDDDTQAFHAMQMGCRGYASKNITPSHLLEVIEYVLTGAYCVRNEVIAENMLEKWLKDKTEILTIGFHQHDLLGPLSPREMEVLERVCAGKSNRQIAQELDISYQTVKNHVSSIFAKLGVQDRIQAALYALRRGWVRLD